METLGVDAGRELGREHLHHDLPADMVALWGETVEMKTSPTIRPMTPLRRLLSEHQNLCERILDERELEVGLWACQRESQKRKRRPASV